jgi:hypothetical protein
MPMTTLDIIVMYNSDWFATTALHQVVWVGLEACMSERDTSPSYPMVQSCEGLHGLAVLRPILQRDLEKVHAINLCNCFACKKFGNIAHI